jgi:hypothetical protein
MVLVVALKRVATIEGAARKMEVLTKRYKKEMRQSVY